jgi:two-component system sensor histidine kinase PhoQ
MNGLIASQRARLKRYRDALGDLAHSLKTPLAVLGSQLDERAGSDPGLMRRQVERMNELVSYQLKRAAAAGASVLGEEPVPVEPALAELVLALNKVYADKRVRIAVEADPAAVFHGDRGDLLEIAGNLLDNACKWCRGQVHVSAAVVTPPKRQGRAGLMLIVDDDGPGIAAGQAERLLRRGVRADERVEGQGIGLAVANEIVAGYGGTLSLEASPAGGARARVVLPPPGA